MTNISIKIENINILKAAKISKNTGTMSDKEQDEKKSKRQAESNDSNDEEDKRSTRKRARVDYNEDKKGEAKKEAVKNDEEEIEDSEIEDVTPANVKKPEESNERPTRSTNDDLMGLPMEPTGLEGAAFQSRVPFDKMTQIEAACFPDMVSPLSSQKMFLNLRNRILQMWLENPKTQISSQEALKKLQPP